ncbi:MFS transporter [Saliniradius amylolyticus]|nr:MFS transporter [Saliniradius amylolyticus]
MTSHWLSNAINVVGLLLVAMMGAAVTNLMPLMVGAYSDSGHFTPTQVGWLTSADIAGILTASVSAFFWCRRVHWRLMTLFGLVVFIFCNWLSAAVTDFTILFLIRLAAGLACGVTYAISLAALGDRGNADKAFSAMVSVQVAFGTLGFWVLPGIIDDKGLDGVFWFFNLCLLPAFLLVLLNYSTNQRTSKVSTFSIDGSKRAAALVFAGVVAYYFAQGTVWAYLERMAVAVELTQAQAGQILGAGFAISVLGSMVSGAFAVRYGRRAALVATALLQLPCLVALYWMVPGHAWWVYASATVVYQIMWSFVVPVMMGIFNDVDRSGRLIVLCVSAFKVGLVIGPPVAGAVVTFAEVKDVLWLGGVAIVLSMVLLDRAGQSSQKYAQEIRRETD